MAPLKEIDPDTLLLLFGLFMMVGGITEMGVVDAVVDLFTKVGGGSVFLIYTLIVWMSVILSAFIDNIPYVTTMLPVTQGIAAAMGIDPTLLYFGLLSGATLGGNLTPIGASANITGIGILRKEGYEVKKQRFYAHRYPLHPGRCHSGVYLFPCFLRMICQKAAISNQRTHPHDESGCVFYLPACRTGWGRST